MKTKKWILFLVILIVLIGTTYFFFMRNNKQNNNSYEANRTSYNEETIQNNAQNQTTSDNNNNNNNNNVIHITQGVTSNEPIEEQITNFTTKIYSKDSARQNNINITCQALNGTIVANGDTFSFCDTIGPATSSKGYQEADIYDNKGQKKKGLGGGNCQISTTLYNAVLAVPSLEVIERHEHSNYVPYIQEGKDAAVAYGSYDFKFKNNSGNNIKILADSNGDLVSVTLVLLK